MLEFILTNVFLLSIGTVIFVSARSLPRIEDGADVHRGFFEQWLHSEVPEKVDAALNSFFVKILRRVKASLIKADSAVSHRLKRISESSGAHGKPKIDFREINGKHRDSDDKEGAERTESGK